MVYKKYRLEICVLEVLLKIGCVITLNTKSEGEIKVLFCQERSREEQNNSNSNELLTAIKDHDYLLVCQKLFSRTITKSV